MPSRTHNVLLNLSLNAFLLHSSLLLLKNEHTQKLRTSSHKTLSALHQFLLECHAVCCSSRFFLYSGFVQEMMRYLAGELPAIHAPPPVALVGTIAQSWNSRLLLRSGRHNPPIASSKSYCSCAAIPLVVTVHKNVSSDLHEVTRPRSVRKMSEVPQSTSSKQAFSIASVLTYQVRKETGDPLSWPASYGMESETASIILPSLSARQRSSTMPCKEAEDVSENDVPS